ncbi:MAG TPA: hypothetical protein DCE80_07445 [Ignavibacteriales bacterium]|nr:hypothetical protein [Ignavibacteriales bacterium]
MNKELSPSGFVADPAFSAHDSIFIAEEDVLDFCYKMFGVTADASKLKYIINLGLLPVYRSEKQNLILKSDVASLLDSICIPERTTANNLRYDKLFEQDAIRINSGTIIDLSHQESVRVPTFFSAARNLISAHKLLKNPSNETKYNISYFPGSRLTTLSERVVKYVNSQLVREKNVDMDTTSQFARSAYYMGSKRLLCGFLIEAISSALPESGVVVDLMCGSGVDSGAFSKMWKTFSSDAQQFCTTLAVVHGGGFNRTAAQDLISRLMPITQQHFNALQLPLAGALEKEDNLFCHDINDFLLEEYMNFLKNCPTLSNNVSTAHWKPRTEVMLRRKNHSIYPYCLFTAYFANIYFGLRQCVEIDSLRFSIDQLQDENEKNWALGALIATVSALGTTYGGHFAQPLVRNYNDITLKKLSTIIDKRSFSITHEFAVRLLNLSEQSQNSLRQVEIVPGPWENALRTLDEKLENKTVLVYVDAPYKREEYSRYYHVLETLVSYTYPSRTGIGLTPKPGERFRSEFFSKTESKISDTLIRVITNILQRGWICAWSYSNSGKARIHEVIRSVYQKIHCDIRSYSVPHVHKSQGGAKPKKITEYLIIFSTKE